MKPSNEVRQQAKEQGLINAFQAAKKLKCSRTQIGRLIRSKQIDVEYIDGHMYFDPDTLEEITIEDPAGDDGKEYVLEWALQALQQAESHTDALVKLSYEGPKSVINALLEENKSLRARCAQSDKTITDVQTVYNQLLRETMLAGIEAEREKSKLEMQKGAFEFLKTKLAPIILENLGAGKLMKSLTDDQIVAFIESGAADAEQVAILKKELARRKAAKQKARGTDDQTRTKEETHPGQPGESSVADSPQ